MDHESLGSRDAGLSEQNQISWEGESERNLNTPFQINGFIAQTQGQDRRYLTEQYSSSAKAGSILAACGKYVLKFEGWR